MEITAAQAEAQIAGLEAEKQSLLVQLETLQLSHRSIHSEIERRLRTYRQYLVSFRALKQSPVINLETYLEVRDAVNNTIEEIEPKYAQEQRVCDDATNVASKIADIEQRIESLREQAQKGCKVIPFRRRTPPPSGRS